jgi:hypothetical protein
VLLMPPTPRPPRPPRERLDLSPSHHDYRRRFERLRAKRQAWDGLLRMLLVLVVLAVLIVAVLA